MGSPDRVEGRLPTTRALARRRPALRARRRHAGSCHSLNLVLQLIFADKFAPRLGAFQAGPGLGETTPAARDSHTPAPVIGALQIECVSVWDRGARVPRPELPYVGCYERSRVEPIPLWPRPGSVRRGGLTLRS